MENMESNSLADYNRLKRIGVDIGGTLTKLVYFLPKHPVPQQESDQESIFISNIHNYLVNNCHPRINANLDIYQEMDNVELRGRKGTIHFAILSTSQLEELVKLVKNEGYSRLKYTVNGTGGGSHKFQRLLANEMEIELNCMDELDCLVSGLILTASTNPDECYYWHQPDNTKECTKHIYSFNADSFPFILVNAGSGVSVLAVHSPDDYSRVSGTSLGGGTFVGLTCLLTGCGTFEESIDLASRGDHTSVHKLVRDIYGGDYSRFNLPGHIVASSFGQMISEEKRKIASKEDLAKAVLVTITNNMASLARMCALNEKINKVFFVGNFFKGNDLSIKLLASAIDVSSQGAMKAIFIRHEGYLGAVGCLTAKEVN